jgi:hypothetical protein
MERPKVKIGNNIYTVKPHTKWHGTLPVYPMVHPSIRTTGTLQNVPLGVFFIKTHIRYHDGT